MRSQRLGAAAVVVCVALGACGSSHGSSAKSPAARAYLAIANTGNRGLDRAFDPLDERDHDDLAASLADLRVAIDTEHTFDRQLITIDFDAKGAAIARALYRANEARAALTERAAASSTLAQLHDFEKRLTAANAPVEAQVRALRAELGLPPPETS